MELKNVAVNIPVAPHRCLAHVRVTPETSSGSRRARVEIVLAATNATKWSGYVHGHEKEQLREEDIKQQQRPKKLLTLQIDGGESKIRITAEKKDFFHFDTFVKSIAPFFKHDPRATNYDDFMRRSRGASQGLSAAASIATEGDAVAPPESPSATKKRRMSGAGDAAITVDPNATSTKSLSSLSFYKDGESKDYGTFGGNRARARSLVTSSNAWSPLAEAPLEDAPSSKSFTSSSTRPVDGVVTPSKKSRLAGEFSPHAASTPAKPRKTVTALFANDHRVATSAGDNKNPKGLLNLGNTCYMNAVVQLLFSLKCFLVEMLEIGKLEVTKKAPPDSRTPRPPLGPIHRFLNQSPSGPSLVTVFQGFLKLVTHWNSPSAAPMGGGQSPKVAALSAFKKAIAAKAQQFKGKSQEDAHEFLIALLDILREEMEETRQKLRDENENIPLLSAPPMSAKDLNHSHDGRTAGPNAASSTSFSISNPVADNFELTVSNVFRCEGCGLVSNNEEKLLCLEASIALASPSSGDSSSSSVTLQRVLDAYFRREKVEKRCDDCGAEVAVKTVTVKRTPRILVVALVRYTCDAETNRIGKNCRPIGISPYLTLAHLRHSDAETAPPFSILSTISTAPTASPSATSRPSALNSSPRALAPLASAKRELDVMNRRDTKMSPVSARQSSTGWLSSRKSLEFTPSNSTPPRIAPSSPSQSRLTTTVTTTTTTPDNSSLSPGRRRSSFSLSDDWDDNAGGYFAKSDFVVIDDDDDMDDELRQVMRMSLLEAEGNTKEADRLRHSLQRKNEESFLPRKSSSDPNVGSERPSSNVLGSNASPRGKVEQLKTSAKMSNDDAFPNLAGFRQMPSNNQSDYLRGRELSEDEQLKLALELSLKEQSGSITIKHGEGASVPNDAPPPLFGDPDSKVRQDSIFDFGDEDESNVDSTNGRERPAANTVASPSSARCKNATHRPKGDETGSRNAGPQPVVRSVENKPAFDSSSSSEFDPDTIRQNEDRGFLPSSYRLVSVISHVGSDPGCGHYVTDAFDFRSDAWQRFNDERVTPTDFHSVQTNQAKRGYVFAYVDKGVFKKLRMNASKLI